MIDDNDHSPGDLYLRSALSVNKVVALNTTETNIWRVVASETRTFTLIAEPLIYTADSSLQKIVELVASIA